MPAYCRSRNFLHPVRTQSHEATMTPHTSLGRRPLLALLGGLGLLPAAAWAADRRPAVPLSAKASTVTVRYGTKQVGNVSVFYREAGPADAPVLLLLHGFPTASHMFRDLIPLL